MRIDIILENAKIYDINHFEIAKGQSFSLLLIEGPTAPKWYAENDPILELSAGDANGITGLAAVSGETTILILDENYTILRKLMILVEDTIAPPASSLGVSVGTPVPK